MKTDTLTLPVPDNFTQNLDGGIQAHLSDSSLTVKRLLRFVGMSRTGLHRKLEQTVGMSTTEYLRHVRLEKAAVLLLEEREWSICQVALEVGFESQSYFTVRFKEVFGCCPAA